MAENDALNGQVTRLEKEHKLVIQSLQEENKALVKQHIQERARIDDEHTAAIAKQRKELVESAEQAENRLMMLLPWFSPGEILKMATGTAGELLKMSGPNRDPYLEGGLGVVKVGAYADLLLVEGNPLEDLGAVTDTENLKIIMKDGVIYIDTLD